MWVTGQLRAARAPSTLPSNHHQEKAQSEASGFFWFPVPYFRPNELCSELNFRTAKSGRPAEEAPVAVLVVCW